MTELAYCLVLIAPPMRGLYIIDFDLSSMERRRICHDRCMVSLLADYLQDIGAAELNAKSLCSDSVLKSGV